MGGAAGPFACNTIRFGSSSSSGRSQPCGPVRLFSLRLRSGGPPNRDAGPVDVLRETGALLVWSDGPLPITESFRWLPLGLGALGLSALLTSAAVLFRPLAVPRRANDAAARTAAFRLVRAYGSDTLAFFKLRRDNRLFFSADSSAFLGYKISGRTLLISGDPVGHAQSLPGLLSEVCDFAEQRGLALGAVGVGSDYLELYRDAGLRALYIGDEAVVDTRSFTLDGRAIRKVRQSVNRLSAAGYTSEVHALGALDSATLDELERISVSSRAGAPQRGFAMAMDGLACPHDADTTVVVGRDVRGDVRGFLHFVPTYGRPAMSLSLMCRDRETPNGLMEFLVARSIDELRTRGIDEISLNFAAFARWLHEPDTRLERELGRIVALGNPFVQIEGLYRFSAKFSPSWAPRHLLYERTVDLPRIAFAALRIEGLLPTLPRHDSPRAIQVTAQAVRARY